MTCIALQLNPPYLQGFCFYMVLRVEFLEVGITLTEDVIACDTHSVNCIPYELQSLLAWHSKLREKNVTQYN